MITEGGFSFLQAPRYRDRGRGERSHGGVYVLLRHVAQETSSNEGFTSKYDLVQLIEGDRCDVAEPVPGTPEGGIGGGDDVPCPECMSMASSASGADTNFDGLVDGRDLEKYFDAYVDGTVGGDANGDQVIDSADLIFFMEGYANGL